MTHDEQRELALEEVVNPPAHESSRIGAIVETACAYEMASGKYKPSIERSGSYNQKLWMKTWQ